MPILAKRLAQLSRMGDVKQMIQMQNDASMLFPCLIMKEGGVAHLSSDVAL